MRRLLASFLLILVCGTADARTPPVPDEQLRVLAPVLRDEARHARLAGFTCVYRELPPPLDMSRHRFRPGYAGFQREQNWLSPSAAGAVPRALSRRLDAALRHAAMQRPARNDLRLQRVPAPLVLMRGRPRGACQLSLRNAITQIGYSRPAFADGFAFVEAQAAIRGTNMGPTLYALQRVRAGWRPVAIQINLGD